MTNDFDADFKKDFPRNKNFPHDKYPQSAGSACSLGGFTGKFTGDEDFYLEYAESLAAGDLRPIVIKDYVEEEK